MMHPIITDTATLEAFCARIAHEPFIAIDTEFMREKTYYPELCLVQIAATTDAAAIDPLAPGLDLSALYRVLANPAILKVFHACRQDMEIFYNHMKSVPAPIFDTQIAAMVCGYGESIGYESLVGKILNLPVDKSSRFTDWSKRPLSDKQVDYAMNDVFHLREIYLVLAQQLAGTGRTRWIEEEVQPLLEPATYDLHPDDVWRKIRLRQNSPRYLAAVQAVARWRELTARARNVPRGRIMKDDTLAEVAQAKPHDFAALQSIRGFYPTLHASLYEALFSAIGKAELLPAAQCPRIAARTPLPDGAEALVDLLRLLLKASAAEHQVVPRLIADKDELEMLATGNTDKLHALQGWRYDIFGKQALQLLAGKIALRANGKNGITFMDVT